MSIVQRTITCHAEALAKPGWPAPKTTTSYCDFILNSVANACLHHIAKQTSNISWAMGAFEYVFVNATVMLSGAKHLWSISADGMGPKLV